jgi:hypothetical protein
MFFCNTVSLMVIIKRYGGSENGRGRTQEAFLSLPGEKA